MRETLLTFAAGLAGVLVFVLVALAGAEGVEATFAACVLCLLFAAVYGPFLFEERDLARTGLRCGILAAGCALVCGIVAVARGGPPAAAVAAGLFAGLYAISLGALGRLLRARLVAAAVGVLLLATLHLWDGAVLHAAADRKASADLAFHLNAAAATSVTLGFDWIHAKGLYGGNQTVESLVGLRLSGLGPFALKTAGVGLAAALLGLLRRRG